MKNRSGIFLSFVIVVVSGLIPALLCQLFQREPVSRDIKVKSFRYGKDPSVIRCNRGDTLRLTFTTEDTGHSFFLEEFDMDVKVSPAREEVQVFKTSDPTQPPLITKEYTLIARHKGLKDWLVSRSNYRCHVWCGPMHAFEQGKLVIMPNTLLAFSLGSIVGIIIIWLLFSRGAGERSENPAAGRGTDLLQRFPLIGKIVVSRWPQAILMILAMVMIYIVILTSLFGTLMSGRNLGVLLMWGVWLFLLVAILTPVFGRAWCTICPLPMFGDLFQRGSFFIPRKGRTGEYNNKFSGLFLKWPSWLRNDWLRLFVFLSLATFSTTLVANPRASAFAVIGLMTLPFLMSLVWESRTFCRYVCPVSVFVGPFSRMSPVELRSRSEKVCADCKPHYCEKGSQKGWACPYGLNVGKISENSDCGLCLECTRSCLYNNVGIYTRKPASETGTRTMSEAWLTISIFTLAIVYSVLYEGHWPVVRDYVNILDKQNWGLFGIYALLLATMALVVMPAIVWMLGYAGKLLSGDRNDSGAVFRSSAGSLLPLGTSLWIAFVIPMLFVNVTFIKQSLSDPFGWGWDFFGTANIPWHQFLPMLTPWLQSLLIMAGTWLSLRNLAVKSRIKGSSALISLVKQLPVGFFIIFMSIAMLLFYTN